jgi:putative N6-adenine-specific DNA methylase
MNNTGFPLIAKTISGLEGVLAEELLSIGAHDILPLNRAVSFTGDKELMYRVNFRCRTALRILKPLFHFEIIEQSDLYKYINEYPWEQIISPDHTISIDAVISYTVFTNSQFVAQRAKDAVVDRIRSVTGRRPSVDLANPSFRVNVHLFRDSCTVAIDSSGQSLHRRGYRQSAGPAPINEVLAAGLIRLSGWHPGIPLLDPMCGSGTILIEAAMLGLQIPAGRFRDRYGFMNWPDFDAGLWEQVRAGSMTGTAESGLVIRGGDRSERAIRSAKENLAFTGLQEKVIVEKVSFEEAASPGSTGLLLFNPPYDERIKLDDSVAFYQMIGNVMKRNFPGWTAWLISSDLGAIKFIGLRPSRKITIFNGPLECRFLKFELFRGKKGYPEEVEN